MTHIDSQDISVVVQGPIVGRPDDPYQARLTQRCIDSIRRHLSGAELVISTWEGADLQGLNYDVAVFSPDPGGHIFHSERKFYNNVNRQIASTLAGLKCASRKYCMKIRSDMELLGPDLLQYFGKFPARNSELSLLRERVLVSTDYSRNPRRIFPYPFHPSDWFCFGYLEDVLDIWDIQLADEPRMSRYFEHAPRPQPDLYPHFLNRYFPEQFIWVSFLRKHREVDFDFYADNRESVLESSEKSLAANLVLLSPEQLGIKFLKYDVKIEDRVSLYTHGEWQRLYKKYCDPDFKCTFDSELVRVRFYRVMKALTVKGALSNTLDLILKANPHFLTDWQAKFPRSFSRLQKWFAYLTSGE